VSHDHHDHGHHPEPPSDVEARALALESLLREKGLISAEEIDRIVEAYEHDVGPMIGSRVVARAWVDPDYRRRLLSDAAAAVAELGIGAPPAGDLVVIENTPGVHNMVVCTLCSCYPWAVLGLPPTGRAPSASPGRCSGSSAWSSRSRCASTSGTRAPTCATWSSPSVPTVPRAGARRSWPGW
jgi:hypothetical protein